MNTQNQAIPTQLAQIQIPPSQAGTSLAADLPVTLSQPENQATQFGSPAQLGQSRQLGQQIQPEQPEENTSSPVPLLSLENVSYSYTKGGKRVVRNFSQSFFPGQVTGIVGPSGAGKTTVLSLLSGLTLPTEGKVVYQGQDLAKTDRYRYRSRDIGVIFQSFNLLPALTVEENIILSMDASGKKFSRPKRELVAELLAQVRLPTEYAKERILHLSGGEQQRVAIARALSYQPDIVIADEPTGNLDLETQADIMQIFQDLAHQKNKAVIIVTHSPDVAKGCDTVVTLRRQK